MKKHIVILLCISLAVAACGCKKEDIGTTISDVKESVEETISSDDTTSEQQYYLDCDGEIGYTVDAACNEIGKYTYKDYEDVFKEMGVDSEYGVSIDGMYDGIIYYYTTDYFEDTSKINFYAIDAASKKWVKFYSISGEWAVSGLDYYNGKVYVDIRTYEDDIRQEEHVFNVDKDSFTFAEEDSEINEILKGLNGKQISPAKMGYCFQRSYDEMGYLVVEETIEGEETKWSYSKYTADGISEFKSLQKCRKYICGYSQNYLYLNNFEDDTLILDCYNIENGTIHEIHGENSLDSYITYEDGVVYYYATNEKQYGMNEYSVYRHDCQTDRNEKLYTTSHIPGTGNARFGVDGFRLIGGQIYVLQFFGNEEKWARFDEASKTFEELDLPVKEYTPFKYGTINYYSNEEICSACSATVSKNYVENFVLDSKYSAHADEINKLLAPGNPENGEIVTDAYADDCEWHNGDENRSCETLDASINDVKIIDDRFLEVCESDYWYGGGAHGEPGRSERIFDLTTGEELGITDFYSGTEEAFKTLVAEKVKEDYQRDPEKYFAGSADEAYSEAYESAGTESSSIMWEQNHAVYYFTPYDLGPFASGFIEVALPYTELLGTNHLTRISE